MDTTLETLFARYVADGDERTIAELIRRTRPRLLAIARRIGSGADAEDAVQTAYLSLLHKRAGMDAPVFPWLVTAVVRTAYAARAARTKQAHLAERLARVAAPPEPSSVPARAARNEEIAELRRRVDRLPADFRDAVVLHHLQGLSTSEVATLLGVSRDVVKKRLERARRLIRARWNTRLSSLALALPWLLEDAAAAALGGLVVKKTAVATALLLAVGIGVGTVAFHRADPDPSPRAPVAAVASVPDGSRGPEPDPDVAARKGFFGVVVDLQGAPIAGATVELHRYLGRSGDRYYTYRRERNPSSTRTARDGTFTVAAPRDHASVAALELHVFTDGRPRTIARAVRDVEARIVVGAGGILRVRVRTDEGPVPGAEVGICDESQRALRRRTRLPDPPFGVAADEHGVASVDITPGRYRVLVHADGLVPYLGDPVDVPAERVTEVDVVTSTGNIVTVTVRDEAGDPVPGATVEARGPSCSGGRATTDADGMCVVAGIASPDAQSDDYWLGVLWWWVDAPGFATAVGKRRLPRRPGAETLGVTMVPGVPVRVRTVDRSGAPVAGTSVLFHHTRNSQSPFRRPVGGQTDAEGWCALGRFAPRTIEVSVAGRPVSIDVGTVPVDQVVTLQPRTASLAGTVLLPDGTPARAAHVGFHAADAVRGGARTPVDAQGRFELRDVPVGPGRVHVRADGYLEQAFPVVTSGVREDLVLRIAAAGVIRGTVRTRADVPVGGVPVRFWRRVELGKGHTTSEEAARLVTDAAGRFELRGVDDGDYRASVQTDDWIDTTMASDVRAGMVDVVLRVKPVGEGRGLAVPIRLSGTSGESVTLHATHRRDGVLHGMNIDRLDDGSHVLRLYRTGTFDVTFSAEGYLPATVPGVRIEDRADLPPIEVRLRRGHTVRLLVRTPDGEPLRGASVYVDRRGSRRTGDDGELEFAGLDEGPHDFRVDLVGDKFRFGEVTGVRAPARVEVVVHRWGYARVALPGVSYGDVRERMHWKLVDTDGAVVEDKPFDLAGIGKAYARERQVTEWFKVLAPGTYRAVVELDGRRGEAVVELAPGRNVEATIDLR